MANGHDLNMSTSFGAFAFANATADHDAFLFAKAREAGSIIMAKKNLGELNGFKDQLIVTGLSALGRETVSPYNGKIGTSEHQPGLMRAWLTYHKHSCGSSGSLAVTVAAGFSPLAFGSETQ